MHCVAGAETFSPLLEITIYQQEKPTSRQSEQVNTLAWVPLMYVQTKTQQVRFQVKM